MMFVALVAPWLLNLTGSAPATEPADDLALQGRWALVSISIPESRVDYQGKPSYFLIVARGRMRLVMDDGRPGWNYAYQLRPAPNALDLYDKREGHIPAAYSVEGERLTIAFPKAGTGRPQTLAFGNDCGMVLVFKRARAK